MPEHAFPSFRPRTVRDPDEWIRRYRLTCEELQLAEELAADTRTALTLAMVAIAAGAERAPGVYQVALAIRDHRDGGDPGLTDAPLLHNGRRSPGRHPRTR
jgi:hypothetical protein